MTDFFIASIELLIFKPDLLCVYMQDLKTLKKNLLLSVAHIEHDQHLVLSPTLPSGCLAMCAFHSVHLLNLLSSGKSWLKHLLPPPHCPPRGCSDLSTIHHQDYFLEMLFKFNESHFNTAKYNLEIVKLLYPFLWRLNLSLKMKCTENGKFLMNLIYLAARFFYPLLPYFSLCFSGLFFFFKGKKNGLNMVKMGKTKKWNNNESFQINSTYFFFF